MGNYLSCTLGNHPQILRKPKSTVVVLPTGEVKQIQKYPAKAAEQMLEAPNHFIVNCKSLKIGRKFAPLAADDDLEKANVYVLFPTSRKNSLVKAGDLGGLFMTAGSMVKRESGRKVGIQPESGDDEKPEGGVVGAEEVEEVEEVALPRLSFEGVEEVFATEMHRLSLTRSRKPVLETIDEEPRTGHFDVLRGRRFGN